MLRFAKMPAVVYQVFVAAFGDLDAVAERLDHIRSLGCDAVYLTPIFRAPSDHKYDTIDFDRVDEQFGGDAAFERLVSATRARDMGLILDAVLNHVGVDHPWKRERPHFFSGSVWRGHAHLPELALDHPEVGEALLGSDGVIARWTRRGATGWRLDCANDLGAAICRGARDRARQSGARDGVVGELMAYPTGWAGSLDGVMNYWLRQAALGLASGRAADQTQHALDRLAQELPKETLDQSWNIVSSHDTPRLQTLLDEDARRVRLALTLAFAYPGVPMIYYGEEIGMRGGADPLNRAKMIWDEREWDHDRLAYLRNLARLKREPALRDGRYVGLPQPSTGLVAFARLTDRPSDTMIFVGNGRAEPVRARLYLPVPHLYDALPMRDLLEPSVAPRMDQGCLDVELPPFGARLFQPADEHPGGYRFFKSC